MPQRPEVKVGVIIRYEHQIFFIRRKGSHGDETWAPGGALEYGESPQECAIRKTLEETNITITDVTFLTITNDIFENERRHDVTIWMEGKYVSGEPWLEEPYDKISACGWTPWSILPIPLSLSFKNFLAQGFPWVKEDWCLEIDREHLEILRADLPRLLT